MYEEEYVSVQHIEVKRRLTVDDSRQDPVGPQSSLSVRRHRTQHLPARRRGSGSRGRGRGGGGGGAALASSALGRSRAHSSSSAVVDAVAKYIVIATWRCGKETRVSAAHAIKIYV